MGWPQFLLDDVSDNLPSSTDFLTLNRRASLSDRQWKGVFSWMLGAAGARHYLKQEKYTWIAPLSAFYEKGEQSVETPPWPLSFRQSNLVAKVPNPALSSNRPDYVALRLNAGSWELAIVEAKGTSCQLNNKTTCRLDWTKQAQNAELFLNNIKIHINRRIVVATRVNPNAVGNKTRRVQIRAWESNDLDGTTNNTNDSAAVDIASAHLFGLYKNLGLENISQSIAATTAIRNHSPAPGKYFKLAEIGELEILDIQIQSNGKTGWSADFKEDKPTRFSIQSNELPYQANIMPETTFLTHELITQHNRNSITRLPNIVRQVTESLMQWAKSCESESANKSRKGNESALPHSFMPSGVELAPLFESPPLR